MTNNTPSYSNRVITICLMVLTAIAIAFSIYWLRPVLVPFVVAIFVVSGLAPILDYLERRLHVNRLIAAGIAFLLGLIVLVLLFWAIWISVAELNRHADDYINRFRNIRANVKDMMPELPFLKPKADQKPASEENTQSDEDGLFNSAVAGAIRITGTPSSTTTKQNPTVNAKPKDGNELLNTLIEQGVSLVTDTLLNLLSQSVIVLIYVFFLLLGASERMSLNATWKEIDEQIRAYLVLKTNISIITGAAFGFALWMFGIPMAITFGLLAFLLNYIPNIGPLVASVLPIPLIILHPDPSLLWMASVIGVTVGIQFVSGNVIEPKIMGNSSDMHPVVVLLALMFWGMLWGIVGMFLATPITAGIKIVLERIEATKPVAMVMAGRWPEGDTDQS